MLRDVGLDPADIAHRAAIDPALLSQETFQLPVGKYFTLIELIEQVSGDPALVLRIASPAAFPAFSPVFFAAACSPNLTVAVDRIASHKRLIAPMHVLHKHTEEGFSVTWRWDDPTLSSPRMLVALELVIMTQIARMGTRTAVTPLRVTSPMPLTSADRYATFFGVAPVVGTDTSILFSTADARLPFLTESDFMWRSFEPELRRRHLEMKNITSVAEHTRAILLECLPSGEAELKAAARRMGMSGRTLQRRLGEEGVTFRQLVRSTRERLALHYLKNTSIPYTEIAFLLGFDEASSFFRAFRTWTGRTPETTRRLNSPAPGVT